MVGLLNDRCIRVYSEMNEWMDDTNRDCHGRDSFGKREMWGMGRQHHRMMD